MHTHTALSTRARENISGWLEGRFAQLSACCVPTINANYSFGSFHPWSRCWQPQSVTVPLKKKNIQNEVEGRSREYSVSSIFLTLVSERCQGPPFLFPPLFPEKKNVESLWWARLFLPLFWSIFPLFFQVVNVSGSLPCLTGECNGQGGENGCGVWCQKTSGATPVR